MFYSWLKNPSRGLPLAAPPIHPGCVLHHPTGRAAVHPASPGAEPRGVEGGAHQPPNLPKAGDDDSSRAEAVPTRTTPRRATMQVCDAVGKNPPAKRWSTARAVKPTTWWWGPGSGHLHMCVETPRGRLWRCVGAPIF